MDLPKDPQAYLPTFNGKYRAIVVFGPPGSGKGTLGKMIQDSGGEIHVSSGDIIRGLDPECMASKMFRSFMDQGLLPPVDEVIVALVHNYIKGLIATNRFFPARQHLLLDGVPRTLKQAGLMDSLFDIRRIIVLEADHQVFINRLQKRAKIEKRTDDLDPAVLTKRMEVYEEQTHEVLTHYPDAIISRFNANQRPLEVLRDVLDDLAGLLSEGR